MFDIFAKLLSSVATYLFPVFASYKALKTSDPALLQPWLMYWVVLAGALLFESWFDGILVWLPFYPWIRLFFLLYLILPQTQGAKFLYQQYVHPFLYEHELAIDDFISSAHDRVKAAGYEYLRQAAEWLKQQLLGMPPKQETPPPTPPPRSYTQSLIERFNIPSARPAASTFGSAAGAAGSTANDFYSLLASAVSAATSSLPSAQPSTGAARENLSNSGTLIPPNVTSREDRMSFIEAQRERLSILLSALNKEADSIQRPSHSRHGSSNSGAHATSHAHATDRPLHPRQFSARNVSSSSLGGDGNLSEAEQMTDNDSDFQATPGTPGSRPKSAMSGLSKSRSDVDFEKVDESEKVPSDYAVGEKRGSSGSWLPWAWGSSASTVTVKGLEKEKEGGKDGEGDVDMMEGKSSGVEL